LVDFSQKFNRKNFLTAERCIDSGIVVQVETGEHKQLIIVQANTVMNCVYDSCKFKAKVLLMLVM